MLLIFDGHKINGNELFAIDDCKLPSNAAKEWSGTFRELKNKQSKIKKLIKYNIKKHQQLDNKHTQEKETDSQKQRHTQSIASLEKAAKKIDYFLQSKANV